MRVRLFLLTLLLPLAACAPSYVWGEPADVERKLQKIVPLGSSLSQLEVEAKRRGWRVPFPADDVAQGSPTYFDDTDIRCRGAGGKVLTVYVADYWSPFRTVVETQWLFDRQDRLRDTCVRKTVDAL